MLLAAISLMHMTRKNTLKTQVKRKKYPQYQNEEAKNKTTNEDRNENTADSHGKKIERAKTIEMLCRKYDYDTTATR